MMSNHRDITSDALDKAERWSILNPLFGSPELLLEPMPKEMDEETVDKWNAILKADDGNVCFISQQAGGEQSVSRQSTLAASRYKKLWRIHKQFPNHLSIILIMAECHFLMNDTFHACRLAKRARAILHDRGNQDDTLDTAVEMLTILAEYEMDDHGDFQDHDVQVCKYSRPPEWSLSIATKRLNLVQLRHKWEALQQQGDGAEQFARWACVSSNELEGVFLLEEDSSLRLARCGLDEKHIARISAGSRVKSPSKIIAIINNTLECFSIMKNVLRCEKAMDDKLLREVHSQLLQNDNIEMLVFDDNNDDDATAQLIALGEYRGVPCWASHEANGYVTEFCRPRDIEKEMDWLLKEVAKIVTHADALDDPYRACAWIQHSYLRIHPFGDGNGRVGRLVSSFPLLMANLPPVFVSKNAKAEYFAALKVADDTGDIGDLSVLLQDETLRAMDSLLNVRTPTSLTSMNSVYEWRQLLAKRRETSAKLGCIVTLRPC